MACAKRKREGRQPIREAKWREPVFPLATLCAQTVPNLRPKGHTLLSNSPGNLKVVTQSTIVSVFVLYPGTFEILVNVGRDIPVASLTSFKVIRRPSLKDFSSNACLKRMRITALNHLKLIVYDLFSS